MKKNIIVLSFAWFVSMGLPACKKDPVKETTPQEKIAGKWLVDTRISNEHYADQDHINSMPGNGYDYADFRTDGKVYSEIAGDKDTMSYSVPSLTHLVISGIDFDIRSLNQNSFSFYRKATYGTDFDEMTIVLKR
jgi:hypothetical protein